MKTVTVDVNSNIIIMAIEKATHEGVAGNMRHLLHWLMVQFNSDKLKVSFDPEFIKWNVDKKTTITYEDEVMIATKDKIYNKGFYPQNSFVVKFLIINYLNN